MKREATAGKRLRVLIAAHSHPRLTRGGAEIAAYELYNALSEREDCEAWFLGCDRNPGGEQNGKPIRQPYADREYIYAAGNFHWFNLANRDVNYPRALAELISTLQPDIVHFHHYAWFGVESLAIPRRVVSGVKIVLTLHEYLAICLHHGQMITRPDRKLCFEASTHDCAACFPDVAKEDFFLRRRYIQAFFESVDHFLSPSAFLAERYVAWGIAPQKISVLENVVRAPAATTACGHSRSDRIFRVGFFGQISPLKGIGVLFEAARQLERQNRTDIVFDIFGEYQYQPADLQEEYKLLAKDIGANVHVLLRGGYRPDRIDALMQSVDVVVVPSIWWENSPIVIEEALRNRRPVLCSGIGGMAEKVRDGLDGFHFPVGSAVDLAALIARLCDNRDILDKVRDTMRTPSAPSTTCQKHVDCYRGLMNTSEA